MIHFALNRLMLALSIGVTFIGVATNSITQASAEAVGSNGAKSMEVVTLGGGCFWCVEAVFQNFAGVEKVESGYAGGTTENPTYEDIGRGDTGHAEVIQVTFDTKVLSLEQVLTIFFHAHDPTTKNRQGNDVGPQYRSIVLYASEAQKIATEKVIREVTESRLWGTAPLTTEVVSLTKFYSAEAYHQNYFALNGSQPYCSFVIAPKVQKIRKEFKELLKG
jgi:peptide-methionine (S)-S-oxide reductase